MREAVTDILIDRSREVDRLGTMVMVSLGAPAVLIAAVALAPSVWRAPSHPPENAMMISLQGGGEGPKQGMSAISARPIQQVAPTPDKPRQPETPPAKATPEMVEPLKTAKPQPKTAVQPKKDSDKATGQKPTTGAEVRSGTAKVETGGLPSNWGGLATGGGGAGGAYTDVSNFCCPDYLLTMTQIIKRNWQQQQSQAGTVVVKFTILRDGTLTNVEVEKPSVYFLNMAAQRAVLETRRLPPLPAAFTEDHLTVHLVFQYQQ